MTAKRLGVVCAATIVLVLGSCLPTIAADQTAGRDWNFNLFWGQRQVGTDWEPYANYTQYGIECSWGSKDAPVLFAWDVFYSEDIEEAGPLDTRVKSKTWQFNPGLRKFWVIKKRWIPYGGLGLTYVTADYQYPDGNVILVDADTAWGFWVGGGFMVRATSHLNLGVAVRFEANNPFSIANTSLNGNTLNFGLIIGWGSKIEESK